MQWLTLVPEDAGIQRLKADNRRPAVTRNVDALSPYPSTHAVKIGDGTANNRQTPGRDRRRSDRRSGCDRRCRQVPVLLDTRSSHDRRCIENRRQPAVSEDLQPVVRARINLYA
jgi:hypothetical protein